MAPARILPPQISGLRCTAGRFWAASPVGLKGIPLLDYLIPKVLGCWIPENHQPIIPIHGMHLQMSDNHQLAESESRQDHHGMQPWLMDIYINWVMVSMVTPGIPTGDWPLPFSVCQMMIDNLRDLQVQDSGYGNNENRAAFGQITKSILKKKRKCGVVFGFYLRRVKFMMAYVFLCHRIPLRETLPRTSIWFFVEMKDTKSSPWVQY